MALHLAAYRAAPSEDVSTIVGTNAADFRAHAEAKRRPQL
jgi:hypothetical protein